MGLLVFRYCTLDEALEFSEPCPDFVDVVLYDEGQASHNSGTDLHTGQLPLDPL